MYGFSFSSVVNEENYFHLCYFVFSVLYFVYILKCISVSTVLIFNFQILMTVTKFEMKHFLKLKIRPVTVMCVPDISSFVFQCKSS